MHFYIKNNSLVETMELGITLGLGVSIFTNGILAGNTPVRSIALGGGCWGRKHCVSMVLAEADYVAVDYRDSAASYEN